MECSFYSFEYLSPSGYERRYEVGDGVKIEHVNDFHRKKHKYDFVKITMAPGSFIFVFIDEASEEDCISVLFKAPENLLEFKIFCEKVKSVLGEKFYNEDKIGTGELDCLEEYIVQKWQDDWEQSDISRPHSLEEAIQLTT